MIHFTKKRVYSVSQEKVGDFEKKIIPRGLVEDLLADDYSRGFAFNQHQRLKRPVVDQYIETLEQTVDPYGLFHTDKPLWYALVIGQEHDYMLSHPLFRGQKDILKAYFVENSVPPSPCCIRFNR